METTLVSLFGLVQSSGCSVHFPFLIEGMISLLLFPSSDYTLPIHMEVSVTEVPQYKKYTHTILHPTDTHTPLAKQIRKKHLLMVLATVLTCAGGSPWYWLTSSASIHQAVEVFPGSTKSVPPQFYSTFQLGLPKHTTQDKIRKKRHTYLMLSV